MNLKNRRLYRPLSYLITLIVLIIGIVSLNGVISYKTLINNVPNNQMSNEELPLNDIVDKIYVTAIDSSKRIITTTNPNKTVNSYYKLSSDGKPNSRLRETDTINILIEIPYIDERVKSDTFYYLNIPNELVPSDANVVGKGLENPTEFYSNGNISAIGGIYPDGDNYYLKVKFQIEEDVYDISATYQYESTFKNLGEDFDYENALGVNFELADTLDFYFYNSNQEQDFTLQLSGDWIGDTDSAKWTTTIVDNKENPNIDGTYTFNMPTGMGFAYFVGTDPSTLMSIYADGEKIPLIRTNSFEWHFAKDKDSPSLVDISYAGEVYNYIDTNYIESTIIFKFNNVSDVKEWKIEVTGQYYDLYSPSYFSTFPVLQIGSKTYRTGYGISTYFSTSYIHEPARVGSSYSSYSYGGNNSSSPSSYSFGSIPRYVYYILNTYKDYDKLNYITVSGEVASNFSGLTYYAPSKAFFQARNPMDFFDEIYIDGQRVSFTESRGYTESGVIGTQGDVVAQYQIKKLQNGRQSFVYRSSSTYNGKYYYIVIDPETYNIAEKSYRIYGWYNSLKSFNDGNNYIEPGKWKIHFINVADKNIELRFKMNLGAYDYFNYRSGGSLVNKFEVSTKSGVQSTTTSFYVSPTSNSLNQNSEILPITATANYVKNNLIEWNYRVDMVKLLGPINTSYFKDLSRITRMYINTDNYLNQCVNNKCNPDGTNYTENDLNTLQVLTGRDNNNPTYSVVSSFSSGGSSWSSYYLEGYKMSWNGSLYSAYDGGITQYLGADSHDSPYVLKLRSFTQLSPSSSSPYYYMVKPELLIESGEIESGGSGGSYISYRFSNNGSYAPRVRLSKTTKSSEYGKDERTEKPTLKNSYSIDASLSYNQFAYNGYLDIADDMSKSTIVNGESNEETSNFKVAKAVFLNDIDITIDGSKYHISKEEIAAFNGEVSRQIGSSEYMKLKYSGNMEEGFHVIFEGLKNRHTVNITYDTYLDEEILNQYLLESSLNMTSIYDISLVNRSYLPDLTNTESTSTTKKRYVAYLGLDARFDEEEKGDEYDWYAHLYKINVITGISENNKLNFEGHIKNYYLVNRDGEEITDKNENMESLIALNKAISLDNVKIKIGRIGSSEQETIYENGNFAEGWTTSTLDLTKEGTTFYKLTLQNDDGVIEPNMEIAIEYLLKLDPECSIGDTTFRNSDYYPEPKDRLVITFSTKAVAENPETNVSLANATNYRKYISALFINAINSRMSELTVEADGFDTFLHYGELYKSLKSSDGFSSDWNIHYYVETTGKDDKKTGSFVDGAKFKISREQIESLPSEKKLEYDILLSRLESLLIKYTTFSNFALTITDDENEFTGSLPDLIDNNTIKLGDREVSFGQDNGNLDIKYKGLHVNDHLSLDYTVALDFDSFKAEAMELGLINENFEIIFDGKVDNNVSIMANLENYIDNSDTPGHVVGGTSDEFTLSVFDTEKKLINQDDATDAATWQIVTDTGYGDAESVEIMDALSVESDNYAVKNAVSKAMEYKDVKVSIAGKTIYDETLEDPYVEINKDNITIERTAQSLKVVLKNSSKLDIIHNNERVVVSYKTQLNKDKYSEYGGVFLGKYSLKNKVQIKCGTFDKEFESKDEPSFEVKPTLDLKKKSADIEGYTSKKSYTIEVNTGNMKRYNLKISDRITADRKYSRHLKVTDMVIKLTKDGTEEEIYSVSGNKVNLPNNVHLLKSDSNADFNFNEIGSYDFDLIFDEISADTKVTIDYVVEIDRDSYLEAGLTENTKFSMTNEAYVTTRDGSSAQSSSSKDYSVPSYFTKRGIKSYYTSGNGVRIEWNLDIDLLARYTKEELKDATVSIIDKLDSRLAFDEKTGVKIYKRNVTSSGTTIGKALSTDEYEYTIINNELNITLKHPDENSNIEIEFYTDCMSTIDKLENYATLIVNNEKTEVESDAIEQLVTKYTSGTVSANGAISYSITGTKYLNGKLSKEQFRFEAIEVSSDGKKIANGYHSIVENDKNGQIKFEDVKYHKEGTYYYKVREIKDNSKTKYTMDGKEYIVEINVKLYRNNYIIDSVKLVNGEELIFNNRTKSGLPITLDSIVKYMCVFGLSLIAFLFAIRGYRKIITQ